MIYYVAIFIKIGSGIQKLNGGRMHRHTREFDDLIILFLFFFFEIRYVG
jgi:hypothetical protein